jgi:hypothetical protein
LSGGQYLKYYQIIRGAGIEWPVAGESKPKGIQLPIDTGKADFSVEPNF